MGCLGRVPSARAMASRSSVCHTGFTRYAEISSNSPRAASARYPAEVSITTAVADSSGRSRMPSTSSSPSIKGMYMSVSTRAWGRSIFWQRPAPPGPLYPLPPRWLASPSGGVCPQEFGGSSGCRRRPILFPATAPRMPVPPGHRLGNALHRTRQLSRRFSDQRKRKDKEQGSGNVEGSAVQSRVTSHPDAA
jgi:hypothetical protein